MRETLKNRGLGFEVRDIAISLLLTYGLLGLYAGTFSLFTSEGLRLASERTWFFALVFGVAIWLSSAVSSKFFRLQLPPVRLRLPIFLLGLTVVLVSDVVFRRFGFFQSAGVRGEIFYFGLPLVVLAFVCSKNAQLFHRRFLSFWLLLSMQCILALVFLSYADGRLLFSDDHPSFLYRLHLLAKHFPFIPFYNTDWNAGYSAREFFPSGSLNVFFMLYPALLFNDLGSIEGASLYTWMIPYLFIFVVPWSVYSAARLFGATKEASVLAGLFALGPSTGFFEWLLKYGTLGFAFSVGLLPLALALAYRLAVSKKNPSWWLVPALLVVASLALFWSLSALALLPVLLYALVHWRHTFSSSRRTKVLVFAAVFLLLNGPWISVFITESKVFSFLSEDTLPGSNVTHFSAGRAAMEKKEEAASAASSEQVAKSQFWKKIKRARTDFREGLLKVNPILFLFFLPGVFLVSDKSFRIVMGSSVLWLLVIAAVGDQLKPQLELRRMVVPASFLMCVLAGMAVSYLFTQMAEQLKTNNARAFGVPKLLSAVGLVVLFGYVMVSPSTVGAVYSNRSDEKFLFAPKLAQNLSNAIREHGGSGRTFFLGFILQELGAHAWDSQDGGHIAPLAAFSGKPLYASDFYHRKWSTVDPIPESYRSRGVEGTEEFLDLVNATAVVTFRREWAQYCLSNPRYRQVFHEGRFRLFVRDVQSPSYFLKGKGRVELGKEGIVVYPETEEVVLKYRYLPKLRSSVSEGAEIYPVWAFDEEVGPKKQEKVDYIGLRVSPELIQKKTPIAIGFLVD